MDWLHSILHRYFPIAPPSPSDEKLLKSFKDRFNYASSACSARILSSNSGTLSGSAVLSSNKDAYLRNRCSLRDKFLVVELCEEIKVEGIVLGNYELFSSTFRDFKVYAAVKSTADPAQPVIWKLLLSAQMASDPNFLHSDQAFPVGSSLFFKYLRIEFGDEHYGHEDLCPLSTLKVYGKNMIDEFNEGGSRRDTGNNGIINYGTASAEDRQVSESEELQLIYKQMDDIATKLSDIHNPNIASPLMNICLAEQAQSHLLKDSYDELERQALILQETAKSNGNIFKLINDRLSKLETYLKNPLNMILFRSSKRSTTSDSEAGQQNPQLLKRLVLDSSENTPSFEEVFSSLNQNWASLQADLKTIQSESALQNTKISVLILFNGFLVLVIILQFFLKRRIPPKHPPASEFKRRPLLELKSPASHSSSLSYSSSSSNIINNSNNPGVVLSDDEVLLLDE